MFINFKSLTTGQSILKLDFQDQNKVIKMSHLCDHSPKWRGNVTFCSTWFANRIWNKYLLMLDLIVIHVDQNLRTSLNSNRQLLIVTTNKPYLSSCHCKPYYDIPFNFITSNMSLYITNQQGTEPFSVMEKFYL